MLRFSGRGKLSLKLLKLLSCYSEQEKNHLFKIDEEYVKRAFAILKPSLECAKEVARYVNEDMKVARLSGVLAKHAPLPRSTAMRYSKLIKKDFDEAIDTLEDREEAFELKIHSKSKQFRDLRVYCTRSSIDTNKCKKCQFKCTYEDRLPNLKAYKKGGK